jgi:pyridoxamine 5'-phosphate oxidase
MQQPIADIRKDYKQQTLSESDVAPTPMAQFDKWWSDAIASNIDEVNAMTLATITSDGKPAARIVLLKGYDENGFVFYTNYESNKAKDLATNPYASVVFFWKELERQVRVEGTVIKTSSSVSDAYFTSRPKGSQIGAWASPQSQVITNRTMLEEQVVSLNKTYENAPIQRPAHWGGYVIQPTQIEFWQGRSSRLHDRIRYRLINQNWVIDRLAP